MSTSALDFNNEIYTGLLQYKNDDYQFVFSNEKLRLIPASKEKQESMWKFGMVETAKGTYTWDEPPRMEEDILVGTCYENNQRIIFLPQKDAYHILRNKIQYYLLIYMLISFASVFEISSIE